MEQGRRPAWLAPVVPPLLNSLKLSACRASRLAQSLSQRQARFGSNPTVLDFAQTTAKPASAVVSRPGRPMRNCHYDNAAAFRKYNSTIGIIGFQPIATVIIDKTDNLDALSI
jgi:hypothetical protein